MQLILIAIILQSSAALPLKKLKSNTEVWQSFSNKLEHRIPIPSLSAEFDSAKQRLEKLILAEKASHTIDQYTVDLARLISSNVNGLYKAEALLSEVVNRNQNKTNDLFYEALALRGILRLRLAELANCQKNHNSESCILPFSANAIHRDKLWTQKAADDFLLYLKRKADDPQIRWLYNVSMMGLGRYPKYVPKQYIIEINSEKSTFNKFTDVAERVGVSGISYGYGGALMDDLNGDDLSDLVLTSALPKDQVRLYWGQNDGTFKEAEATAGLSAQRGVLNISQVDFNNDGIIDLYLHRGGWHDADESLKVFNTMMKGVGNGRYQDVTELVGLRSAHNTNVASVWLDFNRDGWEDLFVCNEQRGPDLFVNKKGIFQNVVTQSGLLNSGICKGVAVGDVNQDGWPDLFLANFGTENILYINAKNNSFKKSPQPELSQLPVYAFTSWFFDYDQDGRQDLFVAANSLDAKDIALHLMGNAGGGESARLFKNLGDEKFIDVTEKQKLNFPAMVMGANFGDFDNDGYLDILLGTGAAGLGDLMPNLVLKNLNGKSFQDVTFASGMGSLQKGHGISFADFNHDGFNDVLFSLGGGFESDRYFPQLLLNPRFENNWVKIKLKGIKSSQTGRGAYIKLRVKEGSAERNIFAVYGATSSFGSNSLETVIGLGKANRILSLEVFWPFLDSVQKFDDLPVNKRFLIYEDKNLVEMQNPSLINIDLTKSRASQHRHH